MKKVIFTILTILWMIIIFLFSNQKSTVSTNNSRSFVRSTIANIYKFFDSDATEEEIDKVVLTFDVPVRKLCHFSEYLILSILVLFMLKSYGVNNLYLTILICFAYACTDEIHQLFVVGRSGNIKDIIIDTLGSVSFVIFYKFVCKKNE